MYYNTSAMKKLFRSLITIALSAPLLSGCSLFSDLPEETKEVSKLELRDYTASAELNSKYTFDGKVYVLYKDNTEKEVTQYAVPRDVDTSTVGEKDLRVDYETKSMIYYTVAKVTVYDPNQKKELEKISISDYTKTVEKGATYVFDGVVKAKYKGMDEELTVKNSECVVSTVNTSKTGTQSFTVSFSNKFVNDNNVEQTVTKVASGTVTVVSSLKTISVSDLTVGVGRKKSVSPTFNPTDATNKDFTATSSDESIAKIETSGDTTYVVGQKIGKTKVTVTAKSDSKITATFNVEVTEIQQDDWTILMYMCGADLESDSKQGGAATEDLQEIASVAGKPDDVNFVVQAGGASSWKTTYSSVISASKRNRFHLENKSFKSDSQDSKVNMGLQSSLQDFLTWGINTYPADHIGLIFWNHGGAMEGCCFDEQFSNDGLTPSEVAAAIKGAKDTTGYSEKFEFIGYDCCLMQVQDIAGLNAQYAKYQVAAEESEWGYGWTYDGWVDDLFAKKSTENILKAIVDTFKSETTAGYNQWNETNDQTLSYLDLSKWSAYETAWEDMASTLATIVNSSSKWNTLQTLLNSCQRFGASSDGWNTVYPYDVFDVGSFCSKMKASSTYSSNSTLVSKITAVQSAYSNLVGYEWHGTGSSGATGLSLFAPVSGYSEQSTYSPSSTTLTNWRNLCITYGTW